MLENTAVTRFTTAVMDMADSPESAVDHMASMLHLAVAHLGDDARAQFFADERVSEMLENFYVDIESKGV